ncbi:hypothetical protein FZEAL_8239 [Fusarium zealandicum]|uniref:Uncharacterized protein n=1 Tax=Fusarium zealandicum TaxID=1053134 RepID=A0A8H4UEW1_9HYPO|nr:hypothetical protein FZEAL_8239 [Fusarium zealandicum]
MTVLRPSSGTQALNTPSDMAPSCRCTVIDHEWLIRQNCRAFLGPKAEFEVGTRLEQTGQWHAFVMKTEAGKRSMIMSSTASDPVRAIESLHENSARAVDQAIACHGYDLPPSTSTKSRSGMRGGDSRPEVIALCGSSDSEVSASDSDDSLADTTPRASHRRRSHRNGRAATESSSLRRSNSENQYVSDNDEPAGRGPPAWGQILPQRQHPQFPASKPPAPGWNGVPPAPIQVSRPPSAVVPQPPKVMPAPPRLIPMPPPGQKTHAALLNLHWLGNGKKKMLVQVAPSIQCLQHIATNEAVLRPLSFANASAPLPYPPPPPAMRNTNYRATVRRVTLGEDTYEMAAFGNDLGALFRSTSAIPKFDIDIITASIYPVFPVVPPPRPSSAASSTSSHGIVD